MIIKLLEEDQDYYGDQLNGLFSYQTLKAADDSLIAFFGKASVKDKLVDYEDKLNNDSIFAQRMLHFILTIHGGGLREARLWQLLFIDICHRILVKCVPEHEVIREGDDIYLLQGKTRFKMSVSIATTSSNGKMLVHTGINVSDEGAPVPTYSLGKLKILEHSFANIALQTFEKEYEDVQKTLYKVAGVA